MSKQSKTKKTKPATKKVAKAPTKSVAKQAAPVKTTKVAKGGSKKPFVAAICALSVAAAGLGVGGFFLGKSLAGGNGGGGGGGGDVPQPGEKVVTDVTVDNLPSGYSVTTNKTAVIGEDYDTDLYLNEKEVSSNGALENYVLPEALTKVSYKIGDTVKEIKKGNYTYTVGTDGKQAHLFIAKDYVLGQIDIELTLKNVEATALKINFDKERIIVLDKSGNPVEPNDPVAVKKNAVELNCRVLEKVKDQYKLTKDSFVLSGNPDAVVDYNTDTGALSIYNVTKSGSLEIKEKSTDAILASIIPNHGSVIYEDVTYSEQQTFEVHPDSDGKVKFEIKLDEGYILTKENSIGVIGGAYFDPDSDDDFVQDPDDLQTYYITLKGVVSGFSMDFNPTELPDSYLLLSPDSTKYGAFAETGAQYCDLKLFVGQYNAKATFKPKPGYESYQFAVKIGDNDFDKLTDAEYVLDQEQNYMHIFFKEAITDSTKIVVSLIEPDIEPILTLDDVAQDYITLIDNIESKTPTDQISLNAAFGKGGLDFLFILNEESEIDIAQWKFTINNLFGYYVDGVKDSGVTTDSGDKIYSASLHVRTDPTAWTTFGYDLELHAVPPVTATAVIAKDAYASPVVLKYQGKDVLCDKENTLTVYPNEMRDVEFELYSDDKLSVVIEDNITIEGIDRSNWEYDPKSRGLYIHNVTQGQSFTIKKVVTCPSTQTLLVSVPKDTMEAASVFAITKPNPTQIKDVPESFDFNVQDDLRFYIMPNDGFTIESQCTATYTTAKGESGTIYGMFNGEDTITFPNAKITTYKSLVISPQTQAKDLTSSPSVAPMGEAYDPSKIDLNLNGKGLYNDAYSSTLKIYVISEIDLEKDVEIEVTAKSPLESLSFNVIPNPQGSDIFDYLITITASVKSMSGNSLMLYFNNPTSK